MYIASTRHIVEIHIMLTESMTQTTLARNQSGHITSQLSVVDLTTLRASHLSQPTAPGFWLADKYLHGSSSKWYWQQLNVARCAVYISTVKQTHKPRADVSVVNRDQR